MRPPLAMCSAHCLSKRSLTQTASFSTSLAMSSTTVRAALTSLTQFLRQTGGVLLWVLLFFSGFLIGSREVAKERTGNTVIQLQVDSLSKQLDLSNKLLVSRQETIMEAVAQRNNERLRANVFIDSYRECMKVKNWRLNDVRPAVNKRAPTGISLD